MADPVPKYILITVIPGDWTPVVDITGMSPQEAYAYLADARDAVDKIIRPTRVISHGEILRDVEDEDEEVE
jgi:hypothetical protein